MEQPLKTIASGGGGVREKGSGRRHSGRELILLARPEAALRASEGGVSGAKGFKIADLAAILAEAGAGLQPLFGYREDRLQARMAELAAKGGRHRTGSFPLLPGSCG